MREHDAAFLGLKGSERRERKGHVIKKRVPATHNLRPCYLFFHKKKKIRECLGTLRIEPSTSRIAAGRCNDSTTAAVFRKRAGHCNTYFILYILSFPRKTPNAKLPVKVDQKEKKKLGILMHSPKVTRRLKPSSVVILPCTLYRVRHH